MPLSGSACRLSGYRRNRRCLKKKYSNISGENCSFAVLLCVTIRATDEPAARR
jgi:hypothetical protein